jgi:hypothetical protein
MRTVDITQNGPNILIFPRRPVKEDSIDRPLIGRR